jgi:hypothetical protein
MSRAPTDAARAVSHVKDERADVTTDGQVSLSNGTVHLSGPG